MFDKPLFFPKLLGCLFGAAAMAGAAMTSGGCTSELTGENPPDSGLYYPINLATSHGRFVYILNSNFDQRYNAGWVSVVDLSQPGGGNALSRSDGGQLRVLSLGGELRVDDATNPANLMVSHRGSGAISHLRLNTQGGSLQSLECGDRANKSGLNAVEQATDCDREHIYRLSDLVERSGEDIDPDNVRDPFAMEFFEQNGKSKLAVGFVSFEHLLLVDLKPNGGLGDATSYSLGGGTSGGVQSLALLPGYPDYLVGTASQRSYLYTIGLKAQGDEEEEDYQRFSIGTAAAGSDLVDVVFSPKQEDGTATRTFAYVAVNGPGLIALVELTMASRLVLEEDGSYTRLEEPVVQLLDTLSLDGVPSGLSLLSSPQGERLFVANFESDEVVVLSRRGESLLVEGVLGSELGIGDGPYALSTLDCTESLGAGTYCGRLVVANFFGHSLSVLDVSGADSSEFKLLTVLK